MGALAVANTLILALVLVIVVGLLRSHAAILRRLHELERDTDGDFGREFGRGADQGPAPVRLADPTTRNRPLRGVTLTGEQVVFALGGVEHDTLLVFLSSGCLTCRDFWDTFSGEGVTLPAGTRMVIVTKDLDDESPSELHRLAPTSIEVVCSSATWSDFEVPGSPYVIAIEGTTGRIQGEGTGMSWEQVAGLLAQATGDRHYLTGDDTAGITKPLSDVEREARVDRELMQAGVFPGDPSLYPDSEGTR